MHTARRMHPQIAVMGASEVTTKDKPLGENPRRVFFAEHRQHRGGGPNGTPQPLQIGCHLTPKHRRQGLFYTARLTTHTRGVLSQTPRTHDTRHGRPGGDIAPVPWTSRGSQASPPRTPKPVCRDTHRQVFRTHRFFF